MNGSQQLLLADVLCGNVPCPAFSVSHGDFCNQWIWWYFLNWWFPYGPDGLLWDGLGVQWLWITPNEWRSPGGPCPAFEVYEMGEEILGSRMQWGINSNWWTMRSQLMKTMEHLSLSLLSWTHKFRGFRCDHFESRPSSKVGSHWSEVQPSLVAQQWQLGWKWFYWKTKDGNGWIADPWQNIDIFIFVSNPRYFKKHLWTIFQEETHLKSSYD